MRQVCPRDDLRGDCFWRRGFCSAQRPSEGLARGTGVPRCPHASWPYGLLITAAAAPLVCGTLTNYRRLGPHARHERLGAHFEPQSFHRRSPRSLHHGSRAHSGIFGALRTGVVHCWLKNPPGELCEQELEQSSPIRLPGVFQLYSTPLAPAAELSTVGLEIAFITGPTTPNEDPRNLLRDVGQQ